MTMKYTWEPVVTSVLTGEIVPAGDPLHEDYDDREPIPMGAELVGHIDEQVFNVAKVQCTQLDEMLALLDEATTPYILEEDELTVYFEDGDPLVPTFCVGTCCPKQTPEVLIEARAQRAAAVKAAVDHNQADVMLKKYLDFLHDYGMSTC